MVFQILLFSVIFVLCKTDIPPTEEYPHQAILDTGGNVKLYWKFTETHITFEVNNDYL